MLNAKPRVTSINISIGGIPKLPVTSIHIHEQGLEGDGHNHEKHNRLTQAVSLQDIEKLEMLKEKGYSLEEGSTGENINVAELYVNDLPIGSRLIFAGGVEIEITRKRPPCYVLDAIDPNLKKDILGHCGVYAKVISAGFLITGESIKVRIPLDTLFKKKGPPNCSAGPYGPRGTRSVG